MKGRSDQGFRPYGRSDDILTGIFVVFEMPRELGHWIDDGISVHCSVCGAKGRVKDWVCLSCGARMRGYS